MRWTGSRAERRDWSRDVPWKGPTMSRAEVHVRLATAVKSHAPLAMWGTGADWVRSIGGAGWFLANAWVLSRGRVCRIW